MYWTMIRRTRKSGGNGTFIKLEADSIKDLWYIAYARTRKYKRAFGGTWTFRIYNGNESVKYSRMWV